MGSNGDPYYNLAVEVIINAVREMKHGTAGQRRRACDDVLAGGLDWWVRMVAGDVETVDAMMAKLRELATEDVCSRRGVVAG